MMLLTIKKLKKELNVFSQFFFCEEVFPTRITRCVFKLDNFTTLYTYNTVQLFKWNDNVYKLRWPTQGRIKGLVGPMHYFIICEAKKLKAL